VDEAVASVPPFAPVRTDSATSALPPVATPTSVREAVQSGRLLTGKEVAGRLGLSTATVYALCSSGTLPHLRIANALRVDEAGLVGFVLASRR
jgi:excisionase family DNA binding protein